MWKVSPTVSHWLSQRNATEATEKVIAFSKTDKTSANLLRPAVSGSVWKEPPLPSCHCHRPSWPEGLYARHSVLKLWILAVTLRGDTCSIISPSPKGRDNRTYKNGVAYIDSEMVSERSGNLTGDSAHHCVHDIILGTQMYNSPAMFHRCQLQLHRLPKTLPVWKSFYCYSYHLFDGHNLNIRRFWSRVLL